MVIVEQQSSEIQDRAHDQMILRCWLKMALLEMSVASFQYLFSPCQMIFKPELRPSPCLSLFLKG
jgi:hypothetical protein